MATKRANGEGSIRKKIVKDKVYWEARFIDENGKQRSLSAKTQSEVRDKLKAKQKQVEKAKEEAEAKTSGREFYSKDITLNEWQEIYMRLYTKKLKPQTIAMHERIYNQYFRESLGFKPIRNITEEDMIYLKDEMESAGLVNGTISNNFTTLGMMFNKAIAKKIINYNPMKILDLSKEVSKQKRALTMDELESFYSAVKQKIPYLEPLFIFLQNTGCRIGEAISIKWSDLSDDMTMCAITKTRTQYYDSKKQRTFTTEGTPKNKTSERFIPLNDEVKAMLIKLKQQRKQDNLYTPDTKIFLSKRKRILNPVYIDEQLKKISKYIQQTYISTFPDISCHWFRHTFASYCVEKNVPPIYLQKIGGWANDTMLRKIYAHMNNQQALAAVQNIYQK